MKGIVNSELSVEEIQKERGTKALFDALKEHDFIIALLQKTVFSNIQYSPEDPRFENMSPKYFAQTVNDALNQLESDVWSALIRLERTLRDNGVVPYPVKD